jgi:membrane-bound lytic murein transglycosylase
MADLLLKLLGVPTTSGGARVADVAFTWNSGGLPWAVAAAIAAAIGGWLLYRRESTDAKPLRRVVMAQDTGSAIIGAVRVDYFWGWGDTAEQQAGRMKQSLRMWVLVPRA